MNYLFIVPKDNMYGMMTIPPGIVYVASALKESGRTVFGLHLNFEEDPEAAILKSMQEHNIDVVCTGGLSDQYLDIKKIIKIVREIKADVVTIAGGGLISSEPEVALAGIEANIGIIGQGEISICEVADALETKRNLHDIDGLTINKGGQVTKTALRYDVKDIDSICFPDYSIFNYQQVPNESVYIYGKLKKSLNITASRSCPYNCTFCYHPSGARYVQRSINNIFQEIDTMSQRYEVEHLSVIDELFATNKERVFEFCERIKSYSVTFSVQLRVDSISEEILMALKESGCIAISYGIESADNDILSSMRKRITIEQIEKALVMTKKVGIFIQGNFIFGDIEETVESANRTLRWWMNHLDYGLNLYMIRVFPGSYLYNYALEKGIIADRLSYLEDGCPMVNVSRLSDSEMKALRDKIIYLNAEMVGATYGIQVSRITDEGAYDLTAECMNCGTLNSFINTKFEYKNVMGADSYCCNHCSQKMRVSPANVVSKGTYKNILDNVLEQHFLSFAKQGKKIVVWGVTEKSIALLLSSKSLRDAVVAVVDRDYKVKNWIVLDRYKIENPDVLQDLPFDSLIIGAAGYEKQISDQLCAMGLNVDILAI
ncbi:MAG: B12-binding domain-containing radical SAM protein [Proteobacteria bacterium]|nr:B12-binding domain-containing radical SAM protein [Pseudomonadota bacterium]MBU1457002.1 B12-binding domain-containing radical SAM protein [Pseudomonadota bacterium]